MIWHHLYHLTSDTKLFKGLQQPKGSRKNKFAFLSVKAPAWQGAKAQ
jgi:hypothetical protein